MSNRMESNPFSNYKNYKKKKLLGRFSAVSTSENRSSGIVKAGMC